MMAVLILDPDGSGDRFLLRPNYLGTVDAIMRREGWPDERVGTWPNLDDAKRAIDEWLRLKARRTADGES